jgi:shikimate kinase/3-dehydroquinate synthase
VARLRGADPLVGALGKHLALIGFMGAGKSTIGREVARLTHRPFVDTDEEIERVHGPIAGIFGELGEAEFRRIEERLVAEVLGAPEPSVVALGGGAVVSDSTRDRLRRSAFTVWIEVDDDVAWERVKGGDRPLARSREEFGRLALEREPYYHFANDEAAADFEDVLLVSLGVDFWPDGFREWGIGGDALIADERVLELHPPAWRRESTHPVPAGESAKRLDVLERLWGELGLSRDGSIVGFGGGSATDIAGFVAATYLRGVRWVAIPSTLTGQVDAAIGGKTGINLAGGKNLVGAFHFPAQVIVDPTLLGTLPDLERRAGMAEVVKTGLLAGRELWELPEEEMIRACAAFKAAVVLSDPYETEGRRTILNLGHTFAHALEAGSGYAVPHGDAVALGLLAALRLSGLPVDAVEETLRPEPVQADPDAAWAALRRDKKGEGVFVLLEAPGKPVVTTVRDQEARRALESLIRK